MNDEMKDSQISCYGHNGQMSVSHYRVLSPLSECLILHRLRGERFNKLITRRLHLLHSKAHFFLKGDFKTGCQIIAQPLLFSGELF